MATRRQGSTICDDLLRPGRLWSRQDVFTKISGPESAWRQRLSEWMEENARVVWKVCEETHLPQFSSQPSGFTECSVGSLIWKLETSDLAIISSHSRCDGAE
jgi:hypothetical protein